MSSLTICPGDNLATLHALADQGTRFDLVELDGPYGAGLEAWDTLTPDAYLAHYAERLALVRRVLQPWGVVFVFGYPEGCAEIKAWARQNNVFELLRWIHWYKQRTAHKARKVESILMFGLPNPKPTVLLEFGAMLRERRLARGWTLADVGVRAGRPWWHRGGNLYYETGSGALPSREDFNLLAALLDFAPAEWEHIYEWDRMMRQSFLGVTDLDFLNATYPEDTRSLNDAGLRSKPIGLYHDIFRPVVPPTPDRAALILYGGSGNAAIAAGQLGYTVTCCETDPTRCEGIRRAWAARVERRDLTPVQEYGPLFAGLEVA